jgi:SAM-dependent methyltransferase
LLNPQPHPSTLKRLYDSPEFFDKRISTPPSREVAHARVAGLEPVIRKLESMVGRKGRLLEIGSGYGFVLAAARTNGWEAVGLELSEHATSFSRRTFGLEVHNASATQLTTLGLGSFDVVVMLSVIEHLINPSDVLRDVHSSLAKDGVLWAVVPNLSSLDRHWHGPDWSGWDPPFHLWHFTPKTIKRLCLETGFSRVQTENTFFNPVTHIRVGRRVGKMRADVREWTIESAPANVQSHHTERVSKNVPSVARNLIKTFLSERDMNVWAYK